MDNKIIERIRKLRALSTSPNEAEAASAIAKVHELLSQYNLPFSDLDKKEVEDRLHDQTDLKRDSSWAWKLYMAVSELYYCTYYTHTKYNAKGKKVKLMTIVGAPHNVEVAKMMASYLTDTVHRLAQEGSKTQVEWERKKYQRTFKTYASEKLYWRIKEMHTQANAPSVSSANPNNLPAIYESEKEKNSTYLATIGIKLKDTKARGGTSSNAQAILEGSAAGRSISLSPQINNSSSKHLIGVK